MTVDPRYSFYLSLLLAIGGFLGGAGSQFADLGLDVHTVKAILAVIALVLGVGNALNAVLAAIPSAAGQTKGFYLGPKPADPNVKP